MALSSISDIGESLIVVDNASLTDLGNLGQVQTPPGELNINENPSLTHLDGLSDSRSLGDIHIYSLDNLSNTNGLKNLVAVHQSLILWRNPQLRNIDGLAKLKPLEEA